MKYDLPKRKPAKKTAGLDAPVAHDDSDYRRRVTIPTDSAMIKAIKVGDMVTVELKAKVIGANMRKSDGSERCDIDLDLDSVSLESKKEETASDYVSRRRKETN